MATYRVRVFTGPVSVREVADRVNDLAGILETRAQAGTQHVTWDMQAADQIDAYLRAQDLLTYRGLQCYAQPLGTDAGLTATKLKGPLL